MGKWQTRQQPWAMLPEGLSAVLLPHLETVADDLLEAAQHDVPDYAAVLRGASREPIRQRVLVSLARFLEVLGTNHEALTEEQHRLHLGLGHREFQQGRPLNALFAATGLPAVTLIENAARNPEVEDVTMMLNKMGAQISWADARTLRVVGGTPLRGTEHRVMGDRIVASTLIAATAVTRGETFIRNASLRVLRAEAKVWRGAGLELTDDEGGIRVRAGGRLGATTVTTRAYPGFHTDVQPLHAAMMVLADGRSEIRETILDGRFRYAAELAKFGAAVAVLPGGFRCVNGEPGQVLQLDGVAALHGAEVQATDIRGGAAVVVAALAAEGVSRVANLYQLERGYSDLAGLLTPLGAAVRRLEGTATPHAARP